MAHDAALGTIPHQRHQCLEFPQGIGIAAAVAGDHDGRLARGAHAGAPAATFSGGGSIWLSMGVKVRMSMMLMSLNSLSAQSAS
jgi:hypothetical protein